MGIKMFCGELDGKIEPSHIAFRADEIRHKLAVMFHPGGPADIGWEFAKRAGWRVVPVEVRKIERR